MIDFARIERQWPDIMRVVASIHTGTVPAYDILECARRAERQRSWVTLAHYGRIFKTLHVLSYVDDEPYRRQIKGHAQPPRRPAHLARTTFHGRKGELRHGYREGMEDQLGALGLILNTITRWNTVYLDHALDEMRATGYPVLDADVARPSPYMRRHINFHGHYSFASTDLGGARRALRDPDLPDDD
jgi:TnpA family transposase